MDRTARAKGPRRKHVWGMKDRKGGQCVWSGEGVGRGGKEEGRGGQGPDAVRFLVEFNSNDNGKS